ncbi:MAG: hypothetical protein H0U98_13605 [Alphaproteobacteria bacterium]|nr:hypothetical protein [Alphaproteobacteria bacterium]
MQDQKLFGLVLVTSITVSIVWFIWSLNHLNYALPAAAAWLGIFIVLLVVFRWQALWFLLTAPFVIGAPLLILLYAASCGPAKSCL